MTIVGEFFIKMSQENTTFVPLSVKANLKIKASALNYNLIKFIKKVVVIKIS